MMLGLCTIQRDRAPWIVEWLAFHYLVGFRKFYFYAHHCTDNTNEILTKIAGTLDIKAFYISDMMNFVQLKAYQHAYDSYGHEVDWMAFIDGDEFLFPTATDDLRDTLAEFSYKRMSALAAYWMCYGSSGHLTEPAGLVTDNYTRRPPIDSIKNRHLKSIVMGRQSITADRNAHVFQTQFGTFDEAMRPVTEGYTPTVVPSYDKIRINHYTCQSFEYYTNFKKTSGMADAGHLAEREDTWWVERDINTETDDSIDRFRERLATMVAELNAVVARS